MSGLKRTNRGIVYCGWGQVWVDELERHCQLSRLPDIPRYIIGMSEDLNKVRQFFPDGHFIEHTFQSEGLLRKTEFYQLLPDDVGAYLFLDSDTVVMGDITVGFEKAEKHGLAVVPAPHYTLGAFWEFDKILKEENLSYDVMQYNTGVIFFAKNDVMSSLFHRWKELASKHNHYLNDQPFFTAALEASDCNPYALPSTYNYRGFGELISGEVKVWHSKIPMPAGINRGNVTGDRFWPPRRVEKGRIKVVEV